LLLPLELSHLLLLLLLLLPPMTATGLTAMGDVAARKKEGNAGWLNGRVDN
jgi:hypothetical protein